MKARRESQLSYQHLGDNVSLPKASNLSVLKSLLELLTRLLSGGRLEKAMLSQEIVTTLNAAPEKPRSGVRESKLRLVSDTSSRTYTRDEFLANKDLLKHKLVQSICNRSVDFKVISKTKDQIIYGHPDDPNNPKKQITYLLNAKAKVWRVILGSEAKAIIPDTKGNNLITISLGKSESYGKKFGVEIVTQDNVKTLVPEQSKVTPALVLNKENSLALIKQNNQLIADKMRQHLLHSFIVPDNQQAWLRHYIEQFAKEECTKGRSIYLGKIARLLETDESKYLTNALCYIDKSNNWYSWRELESGVKLGLRYEPDGNIDLILPADIALKQDCLVLIGHKSIEKKGFAGGQLLNVKKDGSASLATNSDYDKPRLSGRVEYLAEAEMAKHLANAQKAAESFLAGANFVAETVRVRGRMITASDAAVAEVAAIKTAPLKPKKQLPHNIKVTSPDGAPTFELHCAFRQEVFQVAETTKDPVTQKDITVQKEFGPVDEHGKRYAADVYVLRKIGADINRDRSNALIIEISDKGEIRFRSGYKDNNFVKAKVSVNQNGREYIAEIGEADSWAKHDFDETTGTPFRSSDDACFMCIRGCLGGIYDETNKHIIENPALANSLAL